MGTQPSRKSANRGTRVRTKTFKKKLYSYIEKDDYEKAAIVISKATRKNRGSNYLTALLSAGILSYTLSKKSSQESIEKISANVVTKIPKEIKKDLTISGRDSISLAVRNTLMKHREKEC